MGLLISAGDYQNPRAAWVIAGDDRTHRSRSAGIKLNFHCRFFTSRYPAMFSREDPPDRSRGAVPLSKWGHHREAAAIAVRRRCRLSQAFRVTP